MLHKIASKKILVISIAVLVVNVIIILFSAWVLNQKTFYKGVRIENVDLSGIDKARAKEVIEKELNKNFLDKVITLRYSGREWKLNLNDIAYSFQTDKAIDKAYNIGRKGNFISRLRTIYIVRRNNVNLIVVPQFDRESLKSILQDIKNEIDQKEIDASAKYRNGTVTFNREVIGKNIEVDKNLDLLENIILERNFSPIELEVDDIVPRVKYNEISVIEKVISTFSTSFNSQKTDRSFNIRLACERINNTILLPGEVFSMDKKLGSRSIDNGYKNAPVIIKGKLIEGVGGGVCQVTTTLYVAVLKTKLEVKERRSHSMPLSYVEPGQDATISEGYIDFKFKNNKEYPVLISAQAAGNSIVIRIVGKKAEALEIVRLKSVIIKEIPPEKEMVVVDGTVPDGEMRVEKSAVTGRRVAVYRETYDKNNKLIEREKISEDVYQPVRGIIRVSPNYATFEQSERGEREEPNAPELFLQ